MNLNLSDEEKQVIGGLTYAPAVSITMPFETIMSLKSDLEHKLKLVGEKVKKELLSIYPEDKAMPVIYKLQHLIGGINYNTRKKSLAIFVSPVVEKMFYLDIPLHERIIIDESFEIRDLVYSKKQTMEYLLLLLSAESSKMYLGNCTRFMLIKYNVPANIQAYERDMPEKVANFSEPAKHQELLLDQFLHHMDQGLSLILKAYPLPVFVLGAEKVLGHFKKITHNEKCIVEYVHGNYVNATEARIREIMQPYIADWKKVKGHDILNQIEQAGHDHKLVYGMKDVWASAYHKNGRLLVVEKDFVYPAHLGGHPETIYRESQPDQHPFYIKDAVDDAMEKVLENGGDVEFVENGLLKDYQHIVLIQFFNQYV